MKQFLAGVFGMLLTFSFQILIAQDSPDNIFVDFPRLQGPVEIDGMSNEAAWEAIEPLQLSQHKPEYRGNFSEDTEIKIAYNEDYLFIAGKMYVKDVSDIRANTLYRDQYSGDDLFVLVLDTYNDNENALLFYANPAGSRMDVEVSNDAKGNFGQLANFDWNTYWDLETVQNDEGWFFEMRIPFSSIRFQVQNGEVVMGLIAYRFISKTNEVQVYPDISPEYLWYQPSRGISAVFKEIKETNPFYISPYVLGGVEQIPNLNSTSSAYNTDTDWIADIGGDIKYNINSNFTLDATINTDFAQVEQDDQQVNLTRFSLFFPEKRQFFQERATIFNFNLGSREQLFYSRRIGLSDSGFPIPIIGGARLVGRSQGWDIGVLNMQTARHQGVASENFGVARLRKQVLNSYSYVGGMFTSRYNEEGTYNVTYGLDGTFRVSGDEYFSYQLSQSFQENINPGFTDASLMRLRWERRQLEGLIYYSDFTWSGGDYNPGLGFLNRNDVLRTTGNISYGWLQNTESDFRMIQPSLPWLLVFRNIDGSLESGYLGHNWRFEWRSGASINLGTEYIYEDLLNPLLLPDNNNVPVGGYGFLRSQVSYNMGFSSLLRVSASAGYGGFYDGESLEFSFSPTWNISRHLELSASYRGNIIEFDDRNQSFDTHIGQLRIKTAFNTKASIHTFIQYNSITELISSNLRFRYNFREGVDLWFVYNEGVNSNRHRLTPALPSSNGRSLLLKYTHTLRM